MRTVIVIGGGAAGMMAAITAAEYGAQTVLVERNPRLGRKLGITGKGRCNLTNDAPLHEVLEQYPRGGRFLHSAMSRFPPQRTQEFFTGLGVPLKTERGNRVFPASDRALDVVDALRRELRRRNVRVITGRVTELVIGEGILHGVRLEDGTVLHAQCVIVATGGASYPATGSTGDGYSLAAAAGHRIVPPRPSLVGLETDDPDCAQMQGLSLRNVKIKVKNSRKKAVFTGFGELLFTHFGLSGPLILSASAVLEHFAREKYRVSIDCKPALTEQQLDARLLRDFSAAANREIQNVLGALLPRLMIPVVLRRANIPPETKIHDVTKAQRRALLETVKALSFTLTGPRPLEEAIVTAGGVALREVDPTSMASKLCPGLYFAGEVLDIDGFTGGFNLQAAWATGRAAGAAAAQAGKEQTK